MLSQPVDPTDEMLADIRARLGRVCQNYTADEFSELVKEIASVRVKYDALRAENFFDAARALAADRPTRRRATSREGGAEQLR